MLLFGGLCVYGKLISILEIKIFSYIYSRIKHAGTNKQQMKQQITLVNWAIIVLSVSLLSVSNSIKTPTHLEQLNVKGCIKTFMERENPDNKDSIKKLITDTERFFSKSGMLHSVNEYRNHKLFSKKTYNYSSDNRLIGHTEYNSDGTLFINVIYQWDEDGFLLSEHYDRSSQKQYNAQRQKIDVEYEKIYENLFTDVLYKCDFKGYVLEKKYLKPDGSISHKYTYKYDFKYNLMELKSYNSDGKTTKRVKYRHNQYGDVLESKTFISNRLAITSQFSYDYDTLNNWLKKHENRKVEDNIFTIDISKDDVLTERIIEYY